MVQSWRRCQSSVNITMRNSRFDGNTAPEGSNGTALSISPDFKGTVRVTDTTFGSGDTVYDPNQHIQRCSPDMCTFDNGKGTCGKASVGVNCYGCGESKCRPLQINITQRPAEFVAAGEQSIVAEPNDERCWTQLSVNGAPWTLLTHIPPLPVGIHSAAVRAACPAHVFSPPANISWEVVDGRPTNTSIQGKLLTNERTPEFTLGANKGRCSFEYWLDDGPKARQDSKGKAFEAKLLNPIPSWPHSKAILSFQSSAGLGTPYEFKVDGVKKACH